MTKAQIKQIIHEAVTEAKLSEAVHEELDRWRYRYHESGHVVAAAICCEPPERVSVFTFTDGRTGVTTAGRTRINLKALNPAARNLVLAAGIAAERLVFGNDLGGDTDFEYSGLTPSAFDKSIDTATILLRDNWHMVRAVAEELRSKLTISGPRLKELLEADPPCEIIRETVVFDHERTPPVPKKEGVVYKLQENAVIDWSRR